MKHITITLILITVNIFTYGQIATNTEAADTTNIYHQALKIYVNNRWPNYNEPTTLFIEKNNFFTEPLPKQLRNYKFEYLTGYEVDQKLKNKNPITLFRIVPLRIKKGIFFISIIPFSVQKEKEKINYINSGGDRIIFEFDCKTNSFRFKEVMPGNI